MQSLLVLLGLGGLFLGWNAPNHYPPWTAFHLELFAALGLCLLTAATFGASWLARLAGNAAVPGATTARLPLPRAAQAWLLAALWPVLQYLVGGLVFRGDAALGLLYGLGAATAVYVGQLWAGQSGRETALRAVWTTLLVSGLCAAGLALAQWLRLAAPSWWAMELIDDRPYANLAQPNHLGLLMVMATIAVASLFESGAIQRRGVWAAAVVLFECGLLTSQSRAAALALAAVAGLWWVTRRRVPTRLRRRDVAALVLVGGAIALLIDPLQQVLLLKSTELRASPDAGPRHWIWLHFWAAIEQRPWLGYGFNQAVMAMAAVADQVHPSRNVIYAHNFVLDLMTWVGIPLALLATAALGVWMAGWLRRGPDSELNVQRHGVLAIWLALVLQSMLEYPYAHSYFLLPAALLAGMVTRLPPQLASPSQPLQLRPSRGACVMAMCAALLLGLVTAEYTRLEDDFRYNRFARANFANPPPHVPLRDPWVLDQLAALNASAEIKVVRGMPASEIETLHRLARRFHIPSTRLDYAKALALNDRMAEAEAEMRVVRSVFSAYDYERIERHWRQWLMTNGLKAAPPG